MSLLSRSFPGRHLACILVGSVLSFSAMAETVFEAQRAHLQWMQSSLADVPAWTEWQRATGELPPDYQNFPPSEVLPDPLVFSNGSRVSDARDWAERREEILTGFEKWFWGSLPPQPDLASIETLEENLADGYSATTVRLRFSDDPAGTLRVRVTRPAGPGPFPAVITTSLDGWTHHLIPRGYAAVGFAGNDFMDDTAGYPALYPDFEFATLPRRAWAVQLVVDYLLGRDDIDSDRIALYGYSRDGKMAMIAAALDKRIAALIAGSTGVGGALPWRLAGEFGMGESLESTTMMFPHWFHPRMRLFAGHEDHLPVDANLLVAAIAPRACLLQYGHNDEVANGWAMEQAYESALSAYTFLDAPARLGLLREPGFHGSIDPQRCLDWLDIQFGRVPADATWNNHRLFAWDWAAWKKRAVPDFALPSTMAKTDFTVDSVSAWKPQADLVRTAIRELLGTEPPQPPAPIPPWRRGPRPPVPGPTHGQGSGPGQLVPDVPAWVIGRGIQEFGWVDEDTATVDSLRVRFGQGLHGDLFLPRDADPAQKLPTVIWLHGYSYPLGYMWVYRRDLHPVLALAQAGYAVFAFDQSGFGYRQDEAGSFYHRHPNWSRLGRMTRDVSDAIDALTTIEQLDPQRIYALGYSLGGTVALHAAALEERVRGVVAVGGFTPWQGSDNGAGPRFRHFLSQQHSVLPRLGLYQEAEPHLPYDFDGLIASLAPRPVLVVQPTMGRLADPAAVRAAVERAHPIYALFDAEDALHLYQPHDYMRFTAATQNEVIAWMRSHFP